jgi:hypothetical protein
VRREADGAGCREQLLLRDKRRERRAEADVIVLAGVVVPLLAVTGGDVPGDEDERVFPCRGCGSAQCGRAGYEKGGRGHVDEALGSRLWARTSGGAETASGAQRGRRRLRLQARARTRRLSDRSYMQDPRRLIDEQACGTGRAAWASGMGEGWGG